MKLMPIVSIIILFTLSSAVNAHNMPRQVKVNKVLQIIKSAQQSDIRLRTLVPIPYAIDLSFTAWNLHPTVIISRVFPSDQDYEEVHVPFYSIANSYPYELSCFLETRERETSAIDSNLKKYSAELKVCRLKNLGTDRSLPIEFKQVPEWNAKKY